MMRDATAKTHSTQRLQQNFVSGYQMKRHWFYWLGFVVCYFPVDKFLSRGFAYFQNMDSEIEGKIYLDDVETPAFIRKTFGVKLSNVK